MNKKKILILIGAILLIFVFLGVIRNCRNYENNNIPLERNLSEYSPGNHNFTLSHDGLERFYLVHIPESYDKNKKTSLVMVFHGGGGNARKGPEYFGLNSKSDKEGFIVVYPEGSKKEVFGKTFAAWNAGRCCGDALKSNIDDVGFVSKMINKMKADFSIDDKRIFATGMSNGAQMSYRLACELSEEIAAIAPSGSQGTFDDCHPKRHVPVLHIQGKADPCSLYEGGDCGGCASKFWNEIGIPVDYENWKCVSIPDYIEQWRTRNGCLEKTDVIFQNKGATCVAYKGCQDGADVELCTIESLGHNWAGRTSYSLDACDLRPNGKICSSWKKNVGSLNQDLVANDQIWEFFKKHPIE